EDSLESAKRGDRVLDRIEPAGPDEYWIAVHPSFPARVLTRTNRKDRRRFGDLDDATRVDRSAGRERLTMVAGREKKRIRASKAVHLRGSRQWSVGRFSAVVVQNDWNVARETSQQKGEIPGQS